MSLPVVPESSVRRPCYVVYLEDVRLLQRLRTACGELAPFVEFVASWEVFLRHAPSAHVAAMMVNDLNAGRFFECASFLQRRHPHTSIIVITSLTSSNCGILLTLAQVQVLWREEAERRFAFALRHAHNTSTRARALDQMLSAEVWPPIMRRGLRFAFTCDQSVPSIHALADAVGYSRQRIWVQWNVVAQRTGYRLQDLLDWLFLMYICADRNADESWASIARRLRVNPDTITRRVRRLTDMSLRSFGLLDVNQIAELFQSWLDDMMIAITTRKSSGIARPLPPSFRSVLREPSGGPAMR